MIHRTRAMAGSQQGQVTLLFVFLSIGFVLLLGFILNTAQQTSRKIEMQGAADAGAVGGAVWMARGMNLMTLNNKGMADVLGVMIVVRAAHQAVGSMPAILTPIIAALSNPYTGALAAMLAKDLVFYQAFKVTLQLIDDRLSSEEGGIGWRVMSALDSLNQAIKSALPAAAEAETIRLAVLNGAQIAGLLAGTDRSNPQFPVARGGKEALATQSQECTLRESGLELTAAALLSGICLGGSFPCPSGPLLMLTFAFFVEQNVDSLKGESFLSGGRITSGDVKDLKGTDGKSVGDLFDGYNAAGGGKRKAVQLEDVFRGVSFLSGRGPLTWPNSPPQPMLLTDLDLPGPDALVEDPTATIDLQRVRQTVQYLSVAFALPNDPMIGASRFENPAYAWLTYAQADVYNPTEWSMFSQNWRAKLARATLLDEKWTAALQKLKISNGDRKADLSFVNTH